MTKISQLSDIGASLAGGDEFVIRDVSDATTPNKKVTSSGIIDYVIGTGSVTGFTKISAGAGPLSEVACTSSGSTGTITMGTASAGSPTERVRISSSGRVGIGTSAPSELLSVNNSSDSAAISVRTGGALLNSVIKFNADDTNFASVGLEGAALVMRCDNSSTPIERLRITDDTYVRLSSNAGGIQFNGDTAAANALDDYEEGTFTPTVIGTTTAGTATYTGQFGKYTKVGNLVTCSIYLNYSGGTGTGNMRIAGLPFTVATGGSGSLSFGIFSNIALAANSVATGYANELTSEIILTQYASGGGGYAFIAYDAAGEILVSFAYYT